MFLTKTIHNGLQAATHEADKCIQHDESLQQEVNKINIDVKKEISKLIEGRMSEIKG